MDSGPHSHRPSDIRSALRIGDWLVEPRLGRASRDGKSVKLEPKVMELLVHLAQRPGQVQSREDLEQSVWTGTMVGYDALTTAIIKLRKALGDNSRKPWLIETVSKKGYRLIATVSTIEPATSSTASAAVASTPIRHRLRLPATIAALLALLAAGGLWLTDRLPTRASSVPSIAILPFANLSSDRKFEYFSDGITEDIITDLSKLSGLMVVARNSAFAYKDQPLTLKTVAEKLGVRYILEGSVQRAGDDLRINVKLIDARSGAHLWAERYHRSLQDIFSMQDDVRGNIVKALALKLTDDEKLTVARRHTQSIEAYDLLLEGLSYYQRSTREDNAQARQIYLQAIRLDPNFARAHAGVALTHTEDSRYGWSRDAAASMKQAIAVAQRAVDLDPSIPQTHWALGYVYVFNRQYDAAVAAAERAIALSPNSADAYTTLAFGRVYQGRAAEAIPLVQQAMRLNPHYPSQYPSILGRAYYHTGQYRQAVETLRHAMEINPGRISPHLYLILSYVALGEMEEAKWEMRQLQSNDPEFRLAHIERALPVADARTLPHIMDALRQAGLK